MDFTPPLPTPPEYIINISSDEEDNDIQIIEEYRKDTQNLLDNPDKPHHEINKKLTDTQCPICFDEMSQATATSCGHMFCLDCIQQSLSSSNARGQVRRHGVGLCPLCRKQVTFRDTILLRLKVSAKVGIPSLPPPKLDENIILIGKQPSADNSAPIDTTVETNNNDNDTAPKTNDKDDDNGNDPPNVKSEHNETDVSNNDIDTAKREVKDHDRRSPKRRHSHGSATPKKKAKR